MTTQKFKVGDKVKVARKCEFQSPEDNFWDDEMDQYVGQEGIIGDINTNSGIFVDFPTDSWWFPTQSLELVTGEETQKEPEKMKQQYVVLVWGTEEYGEVNCGKPVYDMTASKTFIGTKKEAKEFRDYMREHHPEAKYKIAKYPFIIEGHNTVEVQPEQPKKLVKKWQWYFEGHNCYDDGVSSLHFATEEEFNNYHKDYKAVHKVFSTMIEVEEN